MLRKHAKFFENILFLSDLAIILASWFLAYYIRFYSGLMEVTKGIPSFATYLYLIIPIMFIWGYVFKSFGLYRPKRLAPYLNEIFDIVKACTFSVLVLISLTFFFRQQEFSRLTFLCFWIITIIALSLERIAFREILRFLRKRGYNLRYAIIVGSGPLAQDIQKKIDLHPELGVKIVGFLSKDASYKGRSINGIPVIGTYSESKDIIIKKAIDQLFIALPTKEHASIVELLKDIENEMVDIKVVPDLCEFMTLRGGVDELDGLPIISLQGSPLYGWNIVIKRAADIIFSLSGIIIASPFMILIAILIKLTSPGSVFYKQERIGIGGDSFQMLKFRTMRIDAEKETGPVWAKEDDPRRTWFGSFLRRTSLDELPQLINVLKGDMSIVGPRPERPMFIEDFRNKIPRYMLRHKMKAGITGWAQVNGWRGNTSLDKRIEYDLFYIENWSLLFDIKIMWLTIWKGLINKNAY